MMAELINIPPHLQQRILKLVGLMDSTLLGNDVYYEMRIIDLFLEWLGEEWVSQELEKEGYNWSEIKFQLEDVSRAVQKVKPRYDLIEDKKFSKLDKETEKKQEFFRYVSKIPLFGSVATFMFVWFTKKTNLQLLQVKAEYYKIVEDTGFRKMEVRKPLRTDIERESS